MVKATMVEGISLPEDLEELLESLTPEELDDVERAVARLAEEKRRQQRIEEKEAEQERIEAENETPAGVPPKANRVVKTINENDDYYWQWREGDSVKSEYDKPVSDTE
ncbi:hypothetical protein M0R89_18985 (plasmid) [Halorussus limi]|uniref:Uncharacterized protein n=1 Tax=Halorussus limi TaxID=2938695 RepID=A0A8U0I0F6_9EURY|nr:hypothetical protein [Halorussus limi]UPV76619.1 hypothetical protein M0R89_18985 [Halorussus limi]